MVRKNPLPKVKSSENIQQSIQNSIGELNNEETKAMKDIIDHALAFNQKNKVEDLNLLDVLNSYDELISNIQTSNQHISYIENYQFTTEQGTKVYRKLLQVQRDTQQQKQPLQEQKILIQQNEYQSVYASNMNTLNQDLHFDFQGSFGAGAQNHKKSQISRSSSALKISSVAPSVTKIPRAPPSMLNSQFQSISGANGIQSMIGSIDQPSQCYQMSMFEIEAFNKGNFETHRSNNQYGLDESDYSTLLQPSVDSKPDSSRIKLPKLSFNDLIQAQNCESFKKWQTTQREQEDVIKEEYNEENSELNQSEEVKSEEMINSIANDSSLMKYSNRQSTYYEKSFDQRNSQRVGEDIRNLTMRFPKLQLITQNFEDKEMDKQIIESENKENIIAFQRIDLFSQIPQKQSQDIIPVKEKSSNRGTSQSKRKQNVIDSNIKLAFAFQTRKLQYKAWKSWLIIKIHKIHNKHLQKLSHQYLSKKLQHKYFQRFKLFHKVILPNEKLLTSANLTYHTNLKLKLLQILKNNVQRNKMIQAKLISTKLVLRSQKLRQVFTVFRNTVLKLRIEKTQQYASERVCNQKRKLQVFKVLQYFTQTRKEQKVRQRKQECFYSYKLMKRVLTLLQVNVQEKIERRKQIVKARQYYRNHYSAIMKLKTFQILQQYAIHSLKLKKAGNQNNFWIIKRFFKVLKINCILRAGKKTQIRFIQKYRQNRLFVIIFKAFLQNQQTEKERRQLILAFMDRLRKRKIFRELVRNMKRKGLGQSLQNGSQLQCINEWLKLSFEQLMENVWKEFPKQKIDRDPLTDHQLQILNYLRVSKNTKYRQFFFEANYNLR